MKPDAIMCLDGVIGYFYHERNPAEREGKVGAAYLRLSMNLVVGAEEEPALGRQPVSDKQGCDTLSLFGRGRRLSTRLNRSTEKEMILYVLPSVVMPVH